MRLSRDRKGFPMAKAIMGHVGGPDPRLLAEVARLRRRVRDLEDEVARLSTEVTTNNRELVTPAQVGGALPEEIITLDATPAERSAPALA